MTYYSGFLTPVKAADKERYVASAAKSWPVFQKYGALAQVETWGEDVPPGKVTGFDLAVKLEADEVVVFAWIKWPDKATADACYATMETDPAWQEMDMPFDGKRMMWGGFASVFEAGGREMAFYDVTVIPVPTDRKAAHEDHSAKVAALFLEHGATAVTDAWGADVPDGKVTDFKRAVALQDGETVAVGWIIWPDKATRDAGWEALMQDPRMADMQPAFDGKRMIYAGFEGIAGG